MDFHSQYSKRQLNGTVYIASRRVLNKTLRSELQNGAGELYLMFKAPYASYNIDEIARVASELGEIFVMRFKVDFQYNSRGFAFLQYIDTSLQTEAIQVLSQRFRAIHLDIAIYPSRNARELIMLTKESHDPSPYHVYQQMRSLCAFKSVRVYEYRPRRYAHIFAYTNNDEAIKAYRMIRENMVLFGSTASISWLRNNRTVVKDDFVPSCCQKLDNNLVPPNLKACNCFTFSPKHCRCPSSLECQEFQGNATTCGIMQLNECNEEHEQKQEQAKEEKHDQEQL
ncbi:GL22560 [Drosophila persimilis]|uniref:GL22560 n=1 Tax=Drosophila persimilis TaxID=7234 RepID=B4H169_DROPE|nr:GL22560 [Drosophila persimilis]